MFVLPNRIKNDKSSDNSFISLVKKDTPLTAGARSNLLQFQANYFQSLLQKVYNFLCLFIFANVLGLGTFDFIRPVFWRILAAGGFLGLVYSLKNGQKLENFDSLKKQIFIMLYAS